MTQVTPLVEVGSADAPPGSRDWALWHRAVLIGLLYDSNSSAERLRSHLDAVKAHEGWRQLEDERGRPFRSYEAFCCARQPFGLGYDAEDIERICEERRSAQARAQAPLRTGAERHAGPGRGRKTNSARIGFSKPGENVDHTVAVLARDHPEHLQKLQTGEYKTAAEARRAAGIARKYPKVTPTPAGFVRAIRRHLSADQIREVLALLGEAR